MLLCLLVAALPLASTGASAASNTGYSHAHLLDSGARIVFVDDEAPSSEFPPIEGMTREQLQREWDRLDSDRPGLGGAIGLLAGGVVVAVVGLYVALFGAGFAFESAVTANMTGTISPAVGVVLLVIGLVLIAGGVTLGVIGGLRLRSTLHDRSRYGEQMNRIRDQLDNNPGQPYYPPPPPGDQNSPPPPPPPPPSVRNLPPAMGGQLALFEW